MADAGDDSPEKLAKIQVQLGTPVICPMRIPPKGLEAFRRGRAVESRGYRATGM